MAESSLSKKLLLKPGMCAAVLNAPPGYVDRLRPLPDGASIAEAMSPDVDLALLFVRSAEEARRLVPQVAASLPTDRLFWVAYMKGGARAGTDLNRDILWELVSEYGFAGVSMVAIDETWAAMRFRPADKVGR